jgi:hypothetical protein
MKKITNNKSLFIRCDEKTYELAHKLAESESRSLNKQIIYMINKTAKENNITLDEKASGLGLLVQAKKQES